MNILERTSAGSALVPVDTKLMEQRILLLQGSISHELAMDFVKNVLYLVKEAPKEPIHVLIDSPGGMVDAGMMIYDLLQSVNTPIELICVGQAYSMAGIILLSGRHGRYLLPNSKVMLHQPLIHECPGGSASTIKSLSDSLWKERDKLSKIIAKHTGMQLKKVNKETEYDHFYSAEEALAANLADGIVGFDKLLGGESIG